MSTTNSQNKKTVSNLYSITIRTGKGINLGSNPVTELFSYIEKHTQFFFVSVEKEDCEAHFQGGFFYETPKRQDHLRRDLLPFVERMYIDGLGLNPITEKGLANMRKRALKVVAHNDFEYLVRYTLKEGITPGRTPVISKLPQEFIFYVPEQFCEHLELASHCSTCYKQEIEDVVYLEGGKLYNEQEHYRWFVPHTSKN